MYFSNNKDYKAFLTKKFSRIHPLLTPNQNKILQMYQTEILTDYARNQKHVLLEHWNSIFPSGKLSSLSGYISDDEKVALSCLLGKKTTELFLKTLDSLLSYQYQRDWYRRSFRSRHWRYHTSNALNVLHDFIVYAHADISPVQMLRLHKTHVDYDKIAINDWLYVNNSNIYTLTALINDHDEELISFLQDTILGDNNTAFLSYEMIQAIVKSDNTDLYKLLGDLFLAARLQKGLRQSIMENIDAGTPKAFIYLLNIIEKNDFIRYSSVKRAISTCTGLVDEINSDKIIQKEITSLRTFLTDEPARRAALASQNPVEIYLALWAYAFYEVEDVKPFIADLITNGQKHQKLVAAYFLNVADAVEMIFDFRYQFVTKNLLTENDRELIAILFSKLKQYYDSDEQKSQSNKEVQNLKLYYYKLKELSQSVKKQHIFSPCVFPWHSEYLTVDSLIIEMAKIVLCARSNELYDDFCAVLPKLNNYYYRQEYIQKLYSTPQNDVQRQFLISCLPKPETVVAYKILDKLTLTTEEYSAIAKLLKYKNSFTRQHVLKLLLKQDTVGLKKTLQQLLSAKNENMRTAGLDILLQLQKTSSAQSLFSEVKDYTQWIKQPTENEKILIKQINAEAEPIAAKHFSAAEPIHLSLPAADKDISFATIYPLSADAVLQIMKKLDNFYEKHAHLSFFGYNTEYLLADCFTHIKYDTTVADLFTYPYPELWQQFYHEHINGEAILYQLYVFLELSYYIYQGRDTVHQIFTDDKITDPLNYYKNMRQKLSELKHIKKITKIISLLFNYYVSETYLNKTAQFFALRYIVQFNPETSIFLNKEKYSYKKIYYLFEDSYVVSSLIRKPLYNGTIPENDFRENFSITYTIYQKYNYKIDMYVLNLIRAAYLKLIPVSEVYFDIFERSDDKDKLKDKLTDLSDFYLHRETKSQNPLFEDKSFYKFGLEIARTVFGEILQTELTRGDLPTKYTKSISGIKRIYGCKYFASILAALSNEKLKNVTYFFYDTDRRAVLSYLLYISRPDEHDTAQQLKLCLQEKNIGINRLVEAVMLSPGWLPLVDKILKWKGFISAYYYFQAHMRYADEKMAATFAKYTSISLEDLRDGAFDLNWFKDCYKRLGKERFAILYDACKYIAEGNSHTRARKYADAATGLLNAEEVKQQIIEKRNKDLLMAYGLIPLSKSGRITKSAQKEMLNRYKFIQQFLKESKNFGAQRRASEALACKIALNNLARNAGFADSMRFTLNMETSLIKEKSTVFKPYTVENLSLYITIDKTGKASVTCEKNGKILKSVPSKLKKHSYYQFLKTVKTELTDQFTRARTMFEQAMENATVFYAQEISALFTNPVIRPLLENLVFITDKNTGYFKDSTLINPLNETVLLKDDTPLRIAHAFDLYSLNIWHDYQKDLFTRQIKQPFKQIFRELYVKTAEELEQTKTRRYDGNQIQPQKAYALLKSRRWLADYENGLEKVYYKENIIVTIYAMCDWFSPSDIEAPTLKYVAFYDRKSFKELPIKDIPDIIFSEVMRDVDLVVSVAHVGGVDPQASHSTIEMRRAIIEFTLPLFKLDNVRFNGNFALITGKLGSYSIHLGSGVIHQNGGAQISVLPVHSQQRGRLFLPFVDDDPKTAEILTKVLFFAEDNKIKDPFILQQICPQK